MSPISQLSVSQADANEQLDACALSMLDCYEEILTQRSLLEKSLDDAYLNMSKARSILGCAQLSALQLPAELKPSVTVSLTKKHAATEAANAELQLKDELKFALDVEQPRGNSPTDAQTPPTCPSWFGALAPLSLRNSQRLFYKSLCVANSIAELQTRLSALQFTYKQAFIEKKCP